MGEAKRKLKLREKILQQQPNCIYCGGQTPASTIDHMPPITIFDRRDRPQGLEFPACDGCNKGSRKIDQAVGFLSRIYPDAGMENDPEEMKQIIRAIRNNHAGLIEEMIP